MGIHRPAPDAKAKSFYQRGIPRREQQCETICSQKLLNPCFWRNIFSQNQTILIPQKLINHNFWKKHFCKQSLSRNSFWNQVLTNRTKRRHTPEGTPLASILKGTVYPSTWHPLARTPTYQGGSAIANGDPLTGARRLLFGYLPLHR